MGCLAPPGPLGIQRSVVFLGLERCEGALQADCSWSGMHSVASVTQRFHEFGFSLVHNDHWITVFAPSGTDSADDCLPLPSKRMTRIPMRLHNVFRRLAAASVVEYSPFDPCDYASALNPISQAILSGRQSAYGVRTVGIAEVNHFYTDLLGSEDHLSPDEHFWRLAGHRGG